MFPKINISQTQVKFHQDWSPTPTERDYNREIRLSEPSIFSTSDYMMKKPIKPDLLDTAINTEIEQDFFRAKQKAIIQEEYAE